MEDNTNEKPSVTQRLEMLADKIGADVHKLVDEFEAFVEREIAKAKGEEAVTDAPVDAPVDAAAGNDAPASEAPADGAAPAADPNAAAAAGTEAPTDGEKTAG